MIGKRLTEPNLTEQDKIKYERQYKDQILIIENNKRLNNISKKDSFLINSGIIFTERKPIRKYSLNISHPNYQTVVLADSFDICKFDINTTVGLKRK